MRSGGASDDILRRIVEERLILPTLNRRNANWINTSLEKLSIMHRHREKAE